MNGQVCKAFDSLLGRSVFLKRYPIVEGQLASALREPQTAKDFQHECLATVYTAHNIQGKSILLEMEFLEDGSLKRVLEKSAEKGSWTPIHRIIGFMNDAACGLAHLHSRGYIHRDIKPANLMLGRRNHRIRCVVTDFGLAAKIGEDGRANASKHARLYRPPEAFLGKGYAPASDVYQLGLVMAQLLGCPFDYSLSSRSDQELIRAAEDGAIVNLEDIHPHVCASLRRVIADCLLPEEFRIKSAGDLILRLQEARVTQTMNWRLSTTENGFEMTARDGLEQTKVVVLSKGNNHGIIKRRKKGNGNWRRVGPAISVNHRKLNICRKLLGMLSC